MQYYHLYALIKYAQNYCHKEIKNVGLSDTEHFICVFLFGHHDSSQDDIADHLQIDKATIAKALLSLENKGFVTRQPNPQNRRKNIINLSDSGRELVSDIVHIHDKWFDEISSALNPEELAKFEEYSIRLIEAAKNRRTTDEK